VKKINSLFAAVVLLLAGGFAVNGMQSANATPTGPTTATGAAACPGPYDRPAAQKAMFCQAIYPARAEGPYYINYVKDEKFCTQFRYTGTYMGFRCESYWPFTNPTVNAYLAPDSAFTTRTPVRMR